MRTATRPSIKIQPLADRVVLRRTGDTEQMRGGLYVPDTAREKPQQGEIIAIGPGRFEKSMRVPMELKQGQKVLFAKYTGAEVTVGDEEVLIIKESDILAVIG